MKKNTHLLDEKTKKNKRINYNTALLIPYLFILGVFILLPVLVIFLYSITDQTSTFPIFTFTFSNYAAFVNNKTYLYSLYKSLKLAFLTTFFSLVIAYPIGYFVSRRTLKVQATLILLVTSPMWINMLLRTLAVKQLFEGPILDITTKFGYDKLLLGTEFAITFGMVYNYIPFMILPIYTILSKIDYKLIEASTDLGASKSQSFLRVILPLSVPGIISGVTIVFLGAATTIVIPKYLGEGKSTLIGNIIETEFITNSQWSYGSAISVALLIIILALLYIMAKVDNKAEVQE